MTIARRTTSILLGKHHGTKLNLLYILDGDDATDAVVTVNDPELELYVDAELIENGESLCWVTDEELARKGNTVGRYSEQEALNNKEV